MPMEALCGGVDWQARLEVNFGGAGNLIISMPATVIVAQYISKRNSNHTTGQDN